MSLEDKQVIIFNNQLYTVLASQICIPHEMMNLTYGDTNVHPAQVTCLLPTHYPINFFRTKMYL